jgi:succinoglycan biosynthesis protein ExoA
MVIHTDSQIYHQVSQLITKSPTLPVDASTDRRKTDRPLTISVIVPVRNEANHIAHTLSQLVLQRYAPEALEILVVDGESTDNTRELVGEFVTQYDNVLLFDNPKRLSSAARNIGIRHARGDVVLIVDGHCEIPDDRMLENLAAAFQASGADCIGRPQPLDVTGATPLQRAIAAARSSWLGHHPDSFIYASEPRYVPAGSVAVAYRRRVFERAERFDESFDACEDYEFNVRCDQAGLRCYFSPAVAVRYFPRRSLGGLFRQLYRYGQGRVRLWRKHPGTFGLGTVVPPLFVIGVTLGWLPGVFFPPLLGAYGAGLLVYITLVLGVSMGLAWRQGHPGLLALLPAVFVTIHAACGCSVLAEITSVRRGAPSRATAASRGASGVQLGDGR